ncbi:protein kinase C-like, phorbol ester/diacylglycerol-binding domain, DC1 [Artemisia annua]|uniref:Protein kinase C-like, phorbol ester/diacylglycerol-binding domain, DC1 n=1 Tax=Artemisia annua TaxID=35608 RepID=A0A2U1PQY0_ARTAN|nr:protein kinase C-like, phorbol ester/diacylglycerol-binding domain, DC1 [Artemisia annua]
MDVKMGRVIHDIVWKHGLSVNTFICAAIVDMYAKCRVIDDARMMFDVMDVKDLTTWTLTTVAVKRLYEQLGQGLKEFSTEIELLKGQKHPNLISLQGYCEEGLDRSAIITYACEPEYISSGVVTKESDVYSFGMVLLEISCGRLCTMIDNGGLSLSDYYRKNKLKEIADPSIKQQMTSDSVTRYLEIAYGCEFLIHGNCAIASVEDRMIYHPSHQHPLAATLEPLLSKCYACGKKHEGTFYICMTCFGLFIHSDCVFLPEKLMMQNATNDIFSHPHPLILSYSFPIKDQIDQYYPRCRVCKGDYKRSANTWVYKCEKCRYYADIPCATSRGTGKGLLIKNYEDSDYPDLLHLPFADESHNIQRQLFSKLVELGTFGADEGNVKHNFHPHPLILVRTECNDATSMTTSSKTNVLTCHNPMKKIQLLCNACVRPVTSVPFYRCVNHDCNFVLHEWCTQLPTQVEKYPGHPQHTLILHSNAPNKFLSVFSCAVCRFKCNGFVYSCNQCDYRIDVTCSFIPQNIAHEVHSGHLLSSTFKREGKWCHICSTNTNVGEGSFRCDPCGVNLHAKCALLLPREITHKYDKHPMRLNYLPAENHKSDYFCEICENRINPEWCFYHCCECAQSVHTFCAPHILQSETATPTSQFVAGYRNGPYKFVNMKFGGIHKFKHHPHPLSLVQGIESDVRCILPCGIKVEYKLILKCQQCKFVIHLKCCRRNWRYDEIVGLI